MLDIDPLLMLLVFVVFVVLMYFLNEVLYKPLLSFMDNRDKSIKNDLESIRGNDREIANLQAEAESILAEARKEAGRIKEEAQDGARKLAEVQIEEKRMEFERKKSDYLNTLKSETDSLHESLRAQIPIFQESLKTKLSQL